MCHTSGGYVPAWPIGDTATIVGYMITTWCCGWQSALKSVPARLTFSWFPNSGQNKVDLNVKDLTTGAWMAREVYFPLKEHN